MVQPGTQRPHLFLRPAVLPVPTWRTWLILFLLCACGVSILLFCVHPFLAVTDPVGGDILVVEGWLPDRSLESALHTFRSGGYHRLVTTGEPLVVGAPLSEYDTYAELAAAILLGMGAGRDSVTAVPAKHVKVNRTLNASIAVREWLTETGRHPDRVDVFSIGAHARRSRDIMQEVLGGNVRVGVYASPDDSYDPDRWWASSRGVQLVIVETIGYIYALLFSPDD